MLDALNYYTQRDPSTFPTQKWMRTEVDDDQFDGERERDREKEREKEGGKERESWCRRAQRRRLHAEGLVGDARKGAHIALLG